MRKFIPVFVLMMLLLSSLACGSDADTNVTADAEDTSGEETVESAEEETEEAQPTDEPEPTEAPEIGTSRDNPAPLGTPVEVPNYTMTLTSATRPATDVVLNANQFNTEPDEGYEYVMVELAVTCRQEECVFSPYSFGVVGSENVVYEPEIMVAGVDGTLESGEMLEGGTRTGKLFFIVKEGEEDLVLRWAPMVGDDAFMEIPASTE